MGQAVLDEQVTLRAPSVGGIEANCTFPGVAPQRSPAGGSESTKRHKKRKRRDYTGLGPFELFVPLRGYCFTRLEISLTLFVTAIAIEFNRITGAFARCAAVLCPRLWFARARGVLAFFVVSHNSLLAHGLTDFESKTVGEA
jgi:hypothetical protein